MSESISGVYFCSSKNGIQSARKAVYIDSKQQILGIFRTTMGEKVLGSLQEKGEENEKHSKKIVSLMLALLMVFSLLPMSSISALAAGSNSPVAVQADDTVTAAPAPVFYSVLTDLSRQSATYYADDSEQSRSAARTVEVQPSDYNKNTLAILWQVSDDGSTFTDAEGCRNYNECPTGSALMYRRSRLVRQSIIGLL